MGMPVNAIRFGGFVRNILLSCIGASCAAIAFVSPAATITSIAGGGHNGHFATRVNLTAPKALSITAGGTIYVLDNSLVRRIDSDATIHTIGGQLGMGYEGDGGPATSARFNYPTDIAATADGTVYIADNANHRVRRITPDGSITTVAGNGSSAGQVVDGAQGTATSLKFPRSVAVDAAGTLYIADTGNNLIRRLNTDGTLSIVAGGGSDFADGAFALEAQLGSIQGLEVDATGVLYWTDGSRIRRLGADGRTATVPGANAGDGLSSASDLVIDAAGKIFVIDQYVVRGIAPGGTLELVAGQSGLGTGGPYGDGYDAVNAQLNQPTGIALDRDGNLYIADNMSGRVRKVALHSEGLPNTPSRARFLPQEILAAMPSLPVDVRVGDVTGDGRDDVVVLTTTAGQANSTTDFSAFLLAQRADGSLIAPVKIASYPSTSFDEQLKLADLNRDGRQDVLIGNNGGITVVMGAPYFPLVSRYYSRGDNIGRMVQLGVMDVNRDGNLDVIHITGEPSGNMSNRDIGWFAGSGNGELRAMAVLTSAVEPDGAQLIVGDYSGDGIEDLQFSQRQNGYLASMQHNGSNGFLPAESWPVAAWLYAGDFDGDGRMDTAATVGSSVNGRIDVKGESIPVRDQAYLWRAADMDGDRRDDLVLHRYYAGKIAYFQQTALGLSEETEYAAAGATDFDVGDIDGDGCRDIVTVSAQVLGLLRGINCSRSREASMDLDGNGRSDLVWRDDARQNLAIWQMDGGRRLAGTGYAVPPDWRVLATGDFNGDAKLDLVWTNDSVMQLWAGDGAGTFRGEAMPNYPVGWRVVATGDVNGDGKTDLLWRDGSNTAAGLWVMDGGKVIESAGYATGRDWWVAGSGDLSGDGRMDVIWTNGAQMQLWRSDVGLNFRGDLMPNFPVDWELVAVGDTSGDGRADLMWRHAASGSFAVWAMDRGVRLWGVGYNPGPAWRVVQTGDYNGDGRTDVVWTNGGVMQFWQSTGRDFIGVDMPNYPMGWSVVRR